jgi:hypothetical protein
VVALANPIHDADLIGNTLTALGFALVDGGVQHDLTLSQFKRSLSDFSTRAANADVGLFYYAGHGLQANGINYLVPVDANPTNGITDVPTQMIDASLVLNELDRTHLHLKMMILDACRNNPFATRSLFAGPSNLGGPGGLADMSRGLTSRSPSVGTVIWYATQPGNVAQDGAGNNGPFALAIAHNINVPGRDIYGAFNFTGNEVLQATHNLQQPWLTATPVIPNFYFVGQPVAEQSLLTAMGVSDMAVSALAVNPDERLRQLFSSGVTAHDREFAFGQDYQRVNSQLDSPFWIPDWNSLPRADEYIGNDVRYFWVPLVNLPVVVAALAPAEGFDGHSVSLGSSIVFFFKDRQLFHISIRLRKVDVADSYEWMLNNLFPAGDRTLTIQRATGDTLITAHDLPGWSVIEITQKGVANENASVWHG